MHSDGAKQKENPGKPEGVIALSNAISANGALVSANLLNNGIDAEQAQNLATVLKEHATLKSLCGNTGDETELDMSGKGIGADGAIMLVPEIAVNGALAKFTFSGMVAGKDGPPVTIETSMTEADFSNKKLGASGAIMLAAFLPKCQ